MSFRYSRNPSNGGTFSYDKTTEASGEYKVTWTVTKASWVASYSLTVEADDVETSYTEAQDPQTATYGENCKITITFSAGTYSLTLDQNGGINGAISTNQYVGNGSSSQNIVLTPPVKTDGSIFVGWECSNSEMTIPDDYTLTIPKAVGGNATIKALWGTRYTITIDASGGTGGSANPAAYTSRSYSQDIQLTRPTPPSGKKFAYWQVDTESCNISKNTLTIGAGVSGNITVTAHWSDETYNIQVDSNNGSGGSVSETSYVTPSTTAKTLSLTRPTRAGYNFSSWTVTWVSDTGHSESLPTVTLVPESGPDTLTIAVGTFGAFKVKANWIGTTGHTINVYSDGEIKSTLTYQTSSEAQEVTLTRPASATGSEFDSWETPIGTVDNTTNKLTIPADTAVDFNVTAKWKTIGYAIAVVVGEDATSAEAKPSSYTKSSASQTVTFTTPTRYGYEFSGWTLSWTEETGHSSTLPTVSGSTMTIAANTYGKITATAGWREIAENSFEIVPIRYIRQSSTGTERDKTNYISVMAELEGLLKTSQWARAQCAVATVGMPKHDFTGGPYLSDTYDAYKMWGSYNETTMRGIGYAGCVAYRIKVPTSYRTYYDATNCIVKSISIPLSRDRWLRSGLRVHAVASNSETPSSDWETIHGEAVLAAGIGSSADHTVYIGASLLNQLSVTYLTSATDDYITLEMDVSESASTIAARNYVWVYLTLDNYLDYWTQYSETEQRRYAIEGSGKLGTSTWLFNDVENKVTPDGSEDAGFLICANGVYTPHRAGEMLGTRTLKVQQNGAPIVDPNGVQFPPCTITDSDDSSVGLNRAYFEFQNGGGDFFVAENFDEAHGAKFTIHRTTEVIPTKDIYKDVTMPIFRIDTSVLVMPFVLPYAYVPTAVQITAPSALSLPSGAQFCVFYSAEYKYYLEREILKNQALYDCSSEITGLTYLGAITTGTTFTMRFPSALQARSGTIIISGYFDPSQFTLSSTEVQGTGAIEFKPTIRLVK